VWTTVEAERAKACRVLKTAHSRLRDAYLSKMAIKTMYMFVRAVVSCKLFQPLHFGGRRQVSRSTPTAIVKPTQSVGTSGRSFREGERARNLNINRMPAYGRNEEQIAAAAAL
jgi:hypothetical protein